MEDTIVKNRLQERFAKRSQRLPIYNTVLVGGQSHCPEFKSEVTLPDGSKFDGLIAPSKKKAEFSAAQAALASIAMMEILAVPKRTDIVGIKDGIIGIYIDLENRANVATDMPDIDELGSNIFIKGFAADDNPILEKEFPEQIEIVAVPCNRKDGADIGIMFTIVKDLVISEVTHVIIVTGDKFGHAAVDCIRNFSKLGGRSDHRAYCTSTVKGITAALSILHETGEFETAPRY